MRIKAFSSRNMREIMRDPLNLIFGMGLPVLILILFGLMRDNIPNDAFAAENFTPGIAVFSFSFISLFSALLIAKDRSSSFLMRLFASPMTAGDFIVGYTLPMLPVALLQGVVCLLVSGIMDSLWSVNMLFVLLALIPTAIFYIAVGLLLGTLFSDRQVGGFFTIFVNLSTWLSGTWFSLDLIGGAFETIGNILPFAHAVELARAAMRGDAGGVFPHLWIVLAYAAAVFVISILLFRRKMYEAK